jgi:hypothetical protein
MLRRFTKKRLLVALSAIAVLALTGTAFAFFTSTGSGAGSASVGSDAGKNWSVSQTASSGTLLPDPAGANNAVGNGANVETVTYNVTNNSKGSLGLASVTAQIAKADGTAWTYTDSAGDPACTASDFSINGKAVGASATDTTLAGDLSANATSGASTFKIEMIDNAKSQNSCQGQAPPIYYTAN